MQTGAPIGVALASVIGGIVAPVIGWRAAFFISFLPAVLVIFIRKRLPESDVWLLNRERRAAGEDAPRSGAEDFARKIRLLFSDSYRRIFVLSLVLAIFDMSAYWFTYSCRSCARAREARVLAAACTST